MIDCYQVFDNNTIKPVKAQIHYLKPIEYDEYKDLKTPEIAALVQSRIQACMDEYLLMFIHCNGVRLFYENKEQGNL